MYDSGVYEKINQYVEGLIEGKDGLALYKEYKDYFPQIDREMVFDIFNGLLSSGRKMEDILRILPKAVKIFIPYLKIPDYTNVPDNSFLGILLRENREMTSRLEKLKGVYLQGDFSNGIRKSKEIAGDVREYISHFVKKEQILFAEMEKKHKRYEGLAIMWALHDQIREFLKEFEVALNSSELTKNEFSKLIGKLFFLIYGSIEKEDAILFPEALLIFKEQEWRDMTFQCREYDLSFIDVDFANEKVTTEIATHTDYERFCYNSETGKLSVGQLEGIFSVLPVDLSFVDENDRLVFFTKTKERIFPRSPASIGREVRNCHPPKSYHAVEKILEEFKAGRQEKASFWINMKDRKILIQYYAIRDDKLNYKGVLEVAQDITEIQTIEGEKRILEF